MSTYAFRAVDLAGVPSRGEVDAETKAQVTEQLRERGLIVLDVSEKSEAFKLESAFDRFRSIKTRDLSVFARQFATLIASGMPMLRSLYTLEDQTEDERLSGAIAGVRNDVEAGSSLADAMGRRPQVFDKLFRAMVRSGESSGRLDDALERIAFQLEKLDALKREIRSAVLYPAFVFAAALLIMLAVVIFIVPVFAEAFKEAVADQPGESASLPTLTQLMINFSNFLKGYWFIWVPGMIGLLIAFFQWKKTERGRAQWDLREAPLADPHRRHRPEGGGGALVPDLLRRRCLGCAPARIDQADRPDRRQLPGGEGDGGGLRLGAERRHAGPPDRGGLGVSADGRPHGLGWRGERSARAHAHQGRRLLRDRGRLEGEGAHLADRAGDDRRSSAAWWDSS